MQIGRGEYRSWQMAPPCVPLDCALYSVPLNFKLLRAPQGIAHICAPRSCPKCWYHLCRKRTNIGCSMVLTLILLHGFQYGSLCSAQYVWICPSAEKNSTSTCENIFLATGSSLERVSMMQTDSQEFFAALQQMRAHCSWLKSDRCS